MEYLNPKELIANRKVVKARLVKFTGPTIRHKTGIRIVNSCFRKFLAAVAPREETKILDCGVAGGGFVQDLHEAGFKDLYGLDIDDYLAEERRELLKGFKTADLSFDKIPWFDNFFHIVTAWCVLPHLENPHNFVREAHRVLKPGGLFVISLINIASPPQRRYFFKYGDFPAYHERNNHISFFTPAVFEKTILKYFELAGVDYFITPRIFNGWRGKIRKLVRRVCSLNPAWESKLKDRWGAKIIYI